MNPIYRDSFQRSIMIATLIERFEEFFANREIAAIAGRMMSRRKMGKAMFFNLEDASGNVQVFADLNGLGENRFTEITNNVKVGDILGVKGNVFVTRTGEKTVRCNEFMILSTAVQTLPEKFHGLNDLEIRYRKRYLDLIVNKEVREIFKTRSLMIKGMREYLESNNFIEVETPIFQKNPCGASANPFITHHDAKDLDLYLRISPETFLKQLIVGGFDRIYEIGKNFRNEGVDASHLQEFTMLEFYVSYWNYKDNIEFSKSLINFLLTEILKVPNLIIEYQGIKLDFNEWRVVDYRNLVLTDSGIDVLAFDNVDDLLSEIKLRGIEIGDVKKNISLGSLIDKLYKVVSRPKLIQPTVLINHPAVLIPLARLNDDDPRIIDSFQLLINGWEIAKGYSELSDPLLQRKLLEEQAKLRTTGDEDAMFLDEDFLKSLEYGMPPVSGVGVGIDRLVAIISNQRNLTDVILFPLMR